MTWSWFWDGSIPPPQQPVADVPEWYVAVLERELKRCPPSLPADPRHAALRIAGDRSTKRPRLVANVSEVTRRALAVLDPDLLFELLILDVVGDPDARPEPPPSPHALRAEAHASERRRWQSIAKRMRVLAADLHVDNVACQRVHIVSPGSVRHPDVLAFSFMGERERCEAPACWLLEQWADEAEARAVRAANAAEMTASTSGAMPSPMHDVGCYRARVGVLVEVLRASGGAWEHGDVADLIVASASDWTHAPSSIGTRFRYDWTADARQEDKNRAVLVTWIRKQLGAPASTRARRASQQR